MTLPNASSLERDASRPNPPGRIEIRTQWLFPDEFTPVSHVAPVKLVTYR
jgi:hypothetical protein